MFLFKFIISKIIAAQLISGIALGHLFFYNVSFYAITVNKGKEGETEIHYLKQLVSCVFSDVFLHCSIITISVITAGSLCRGGGKYCLPFQMYSLFHSHFRYIFIPIYTSSYTPIIFSFYGVTRSCIALQWEQSSMAKIVSADSVPRCFLLIVS